MAAKVIEVRIPCAGEVFVKASLGSVYLVVNKRGFINATQLCALGERKLQKYTALERRRTVESMVREHYSQELTLMVSSRRVAVAGTYYHPLLLLDLASWLSPALFAHAATIMVEYYNRGGRKCMLAKLLCGETATCEQTQSAPQRWSLRYPSLELLVDERGWFDAVAFCAANQTSRAEFEAGPDVASLRTYLRRRGSMDNGQFYHPLLFLELVACVNFTVYMKCARVVFGFTDAKLNLLIRKAMAAASSTPAAARPNQLSGQRVTEQRPAPAGIQTFQGPATNSRAALDDEQPSTSAALAIFSGLRPEGIIVNDDDDDSTIGSESAGEEEGMVTMTEHQVALQRERRKWQQREEALLRQKNAEMEEKLRQKEVEKQHLLYQKDAEAERKLREKEDEFNALQEKFENLRISYSRERLRKRPVEEPVAEPAVGAVIIDSVVAKQECVVLFSSRDNQVYAYRRQLRTVVNAIQKECTNIREFIGWFITNNAVFDYNRCKALVTQKAAECGHRVRVKTNEMQLDQESGGEFDLSDAVCTALRLEMKVVEADVRILGTLFGKPTRSEGYVAPTDAKTAEMLKRIHRWITEQHTRYMKYRSRHPR